MKISDFEKEIQAIDPRFSIIENENRPGLSNIFFEGENYDLPPVPSVEIKDEPDPRYFYTFPNGYSHRYWSRADVIPRLKDFIANLESIRKERNED